MVNTVYKHPVDNMENLLKYKKIKEKLSTYYVDNFFCYFITFFISSSLEESIKGIPFSSNN